MKIVVFALDESTYIPAPLDLTAQSLGNRIACIVAFPPPARGGRISSIIERCGFLGARGCFVLAFRALRRRLPFGSQRNLCSVSAVAARHGIPAYRADAVSSALVADVLARHPAELLLSLSCPQIIGAGVRARFPAGAINVHAAPLPKYRGQMPSFWVLARGEKRTAVTVHDITDALDAGEILVQREIEIAPGESWDSLLRKTKTAGALAALEAIRQIEAGSAVRAPNRDEESTRFGFPTVQDARDFRARGGRMV